MNNEIAILLNQIGPGKMSATAYDTAWVARLAEVDRELSNHALEWLIENQLPDGSWGAAAPLYYHDRVISTLAAMIALTKYGRRALDRAQIERGLIALEKITKQTTKDLTADPNGATIGFEMIVPTLVAEAHELGILKQNSQSILSRLSALRKTKLTRMMGRKINRQVTMAFSAEMAGLDGQEILDVENIQEENGSLGNSLSATAYYAIYVKYQNPSALTYLREWTHADGGAPNVAPFDIFEPAWALWNLNLIPDLKQDLLSLGASHIDYLHSHWSDEKGIGHDSQFTPKDGDDSGLVFELLHGFGRTVNIDAVLYYEETDHFRCFDLEANPSISTNIHVLGALLAAGYDASRPAVQKILRFLLSNRTGGKFWFDKWHASPYYATSHTIILAGACAKEMCATAVQWILDTQRSNGAWGFYGPTAEETAYALQALCIWRRSGGKVPKEKIELGRNWLEKHANKPFEPLWIGKGLYSPELVVRSAVLSAMTLAKED